MPLNKTKRPDRTYVPEKLPDYTRYQNLEAERKPPAAVMVDNDLNSLVDYGNYLADAIDNVEAGAIAGADDEENVNKVVTTNGEVVSWVSITDENIEEGGITDISIAQNTITGGADGSIGLGTITDANIADNTINIDKLRNTLNFASALVTYNNAALGIGQSRFTEYGQVLAYTPSLTSGPSATKLADVWNVIPNSTCAGAKISVGTIPGNRMENLTITTDKLALNTPLEFFKIFFPIGSVYITFINMSPPYHGAGMTWQILQDGVAIVTATGGAGSNVGTVGGVNRLDNGDTNGTAITIQQMPAHTHNVVAGSPSPIQAIGGQHGDANLCNANNLTTTSTGGDQPHAHGLNVLNLKLMFFRRTA